MKINIKPTDSLNYQSLLSLENSDIVANKFQLDVQDIDLELVSQYLGKDSAIIFSKPKTTGEEYAIKEQYRKAGASAWGKVSELKLTSFSFESSATEVNTICFLEGLFLASYKFDQHLSKKAEIVDIEISQELATSSLFVEITNLVLASTWTKNMVNEPVNILNTQQFSAEMIAMGKDAGFEVEVLEKKQIEALKMGGLLAVNKG
ncbi:hypothetical protein OAH12_03035, partial [Cyclobacteriaceae bacterium]|nr:hypothetical protein [Cyclobacteriaceae bacterium]